MHISRTTVTQDVQARFFVQLAFAKFLFKIKRNFEYSACIMNKALPQKFPFILDRNLAKANCTGNRVCTSCDTVVLGTNINNSIKFISEACIPLLSNIYKYTNNNVFPTIFESWTLFPTIVHKSQGQEHIDNFWIEFLTSNFLANYRKVFCTRINLFFNCTKIIFIRIKFLFS